MPGSAVLQTRHTCGARFDDFMPKTTTAATTPSAVTAPRAVSTRVPDFIDTSDASCGAVITSAADGMTAPCGGNIVTGAAGGAVRARLADSDASWPLRQLT